MDSAEIIPQRWPNFSNEWTIIIYPDNVFNMVKTITVNLFFGTHLFVMVLWGMVCGSGFTPVYIYIYVCVCGGNPCSEGLWSHVQFLVTVPNLQAGAHGILDPPCATKLRSWMGYQGLITLTYLQLVTMFFHYPSFLMTFRLLFFNICMNNSRNRSPLTHFSVFTHFCDFCPMWTKTAFLN